MDSARDKETLEEVDAFELLQRVLDEEDPLDAGTIETREFICLACIAAMTPIAIKPMMKRSPHFRLKVEEKHELGCNVDGYEKLVEKSSNHQVSTSAGFPFPYPSRLSLPEFREVIDASSAQEMARPRNRSNVSSTYSQEGTGKKHNLTVTSIKRIVKHFVSFTHPKDRCLSLSIPGVVATTYAEVFQRLRYRPGFHYDKSRIYFGKLLYKDRLITNNKIRLSLTEGIWEDNKPVRTFFLEIDMNSWSTAQKAVLRREIEDCFETLQEKRATDPKAQPWLFFLGQQNTEDGFKFRLLKNDYRLVCCLVSSSLHKEPFSTVATPAQAYKEAHKPLAAETESEILIQSEQELTFLHQQSRFTEPKTSNYVTPTTAEEPVYPFEHPLLPNSQEDLEENSFEDIAVSQNSDIPWNSERFATQEQSRQEQPITQQTTRVEGAEVSSISNYTTAEERWRTTNQLLKASKDLDRKPIQTKSEAQFSSRRRKRKGPLNRLKKVVKRLISAFQSLVRFFRN